MNEALDIHSLALAGGGALEVLTPELAVGGEGAVYRVREPADQVLKHYLPKVLASKGPILAAKVQAMVDNPPNDPTAGIGHVSLAWPRAVVVDDSNRFAGYLMPLINTSSSVELHMVSNPADRKRSAKAPPWLGGFTWEYLLRAATNLASAVQALHDAGYVIGDFNERNVLVWMNALVTLVDCDSMQVPGPSGTSFLCEVTRPEFTAPELLHANLANEIRSPESDLFALGVHVYQLLMEGRHPFAGIWHGGGDKPERHRLAEQGLFVQLGDRRLTAQLGTPPFAIFNDDIRALFVRCFAEGASDPKRRPTGEEWFRALQDLANSLVTCTTAASHRYPGHLGVACPWCELDKGATVITARHTAIQVPLPPALAPNRPPAQPRPSPHWTPPPVAGGWLPTSTPQWQPPGWAPPKVRRPAPLRWGRKHPRLAVLAIVVLLWIMGSVDRQNTSASAAWPAGATPAGVLAPVLHSLQSCAEAATLQPANCPQSDAGLGQASGVIWTLYGDPGSGAEISYSNSVFTVLGHAVMTLQYSTGLQPPQSLTVVPIGYDATERWNGGHPTLDSLLPLQQEPTPAITQPRPKTTDAAIKQAFRAQFSRCISTTNPSLEMPPICPQVDSLSGPGTMKVHWRKDADPLLNSKVTYDVAYGIFHLIGSFAVTVTYEDDAGNPQTANFGGNYDAQLAVRGKTPVVLIIAKT